jgi:hypothetical protein
MDRDVGRHGDRHSGREFMSIPSTCLIETDQLRSELFCFFAAAGQLPFA